MAVTWCKRYRMVYDLRKELPQTAPLADGYRLVPWSPAILDAHAAVKYYSFRDEIDAHVFLSLSTLDGCRNLMREITRRDSFLPEATWMIVHRENPEARIEYCATIQALRTSQVEGSIQNVGVVPKHRKRGLASILLKSALEGMAARGLSTASLEVTSINREAVKLYHEAGFRLERPVFKAIEIFPPP